MITPEDLATAAKELREEDEKAVNIIDNEMQTYLATLRDDDLARAKGNYEEMLDICEKDNEKAFGIFEQNAPTSKDEKELALHKEVLRSSLELSRNVLSSLVAMRVS